MGDKQPTLKIPKLVISKAVVKAVEGGKSTGATSRSSLQALDQARPDPKSVALLSETITDGSRDELRLSDLIAIIAKQCHDDIDHYTHKFSNMSAVDRKRFLLNIFMSQQDWLQKLHRVLQWLPYLNESLLSEAAVGLIESRNRTFAEASDQLTAINGAMVSSRSPAIPITDTLPMLAGVPPRVPYALSRLLGVNLEADVPKEREITIFTRKTAQSTITGLYSCSRFEFHGPHLTCYSHDDGVKLEIKLFPCGASSRWHLQSLFLKNDPAIAKALFPLLSDTINNLQNLSDLLDISLILKIIDQCRLDELMTSLVSELRMLIRGVARDSNNLMDVLVDSGQIRISFQINSKSIGSQLIFFVSVKPDLRSVEIANMEGVFGEMTTEFSQSSLTAISLWVLNSVLRSCHKSITTTLCGLLSCQLGNLLYFVVEGGDNLVIVAKIANSPLCSIRLDIINLDVDLVVQGPRKSFSLELRHENFCNLLVTDLRRLATFSLCSRINSALFGISLICCNRDASSAGDLLLSFLSHPGSYLIFKDIFAARDDEAFECDYIEIPRYGILSEPSFRLTVAKFVFNEWELLSWAALLEPVTRRLRLRQIERAGLIMAGSNNPLEKDLIIVNAPIIYPVIMVCATSIDLDRIDLRFIFPTSKGDTDGVVRSFKETDLSQLPGFIQTSSRELGLR